MLVHCEFRIECGNQYCVHYEEHEHGEVESFTHHGALMLSSCEVSRCAVMSEKIGETECGCVPAGDEEDIV